MINDIELYRPGLAAGRSLCNSSLCSLHGLQAFFLSVVQARLLNAQPPVADASDASQTWCSRAREKVATANALMNALLLKHRELQLCLKD